MRRLLALFALLTSVLVVLVVAPGAAANDMECIGTITGGTHDNIVVPPGQTCILNGVTVLGNVKALEDSRLRIASSSNIRGNVEGDNADVVQVVDSTVRENIIIKEAGPPVPLLFGFSRCVNFPFPQTTCEALVARVTVEQGSVQLEKVDGTAVVTATGLLSPIRGNVKMEDNFASAAEFMAVLTNSVAQNVQVFKNKGPGGKAVSGNTVGESLQCFENDPPFSGTVLNVAREAQGQCSAMPLPVSLAFSGPAIYVE